MYEITKREIIVSVTIICLMILLGIPISHKIQENTMDKNEVYYKAIKISDTDLFQHGMNTNVGNAFVYGDYEAVDTVSYPEIDGKYMYITKNTEEYRRHTRTVYTYDEEGNVTGSYEEEYWTWDEMKRERLKCENILFCGVQFHSDKISIPYSHYIDTIYVHSKLRHIYRGCDTKYNGTIFTKLENGDISERTEFYQDLSIDETIDRLLISETGMVIIFWIGWLLLTAFIVIMFYKLENNWLE